jgi:hypothetical protein
MDLLNLVSLETLNAALDCPFIQLLLAGLAIILIIELQIWRLFHQVKLIEALPSVKDHLKYVKTKRKK